MFVPLCINLCGSQGYRPERYSLYLWYCAVVPIRTNSEFLRLGTHLEQNKCLLSPRRNAQKCSLLWLKDMAKRAKQEKLLRQDAIIGSRADVQSRESSIAARAQRRSCRGHRQAAEHEPPSRAPNVAPGAPTPCHKREPLERRFWSRCCVLLQLCVLVLGGRSSSLPSHRSSCRDVVVLAASCCAHSVSQNEGHSNCVLGSVLYSAALVCACAGWPKLAVSLM